MTEPMTDSQLEFLRVSPWLCGELIGSLIARVDAAEKEVQKLTTLDCDCNGSTLSSTFQPCCGITWEDEQHKETCKRYCRICKGDNEDCECGMLISLNQAVAQGIKKVRNPEWMFVDYIDVPTTEEERRWTSIVCPDSERPGPRVFLTDMDEEKWERYE